MTGSVGTHFIISIVYGSYWDRIDRQPLTYKTCAIIDFDFDTFSRLHLKPSLFIRNYGLNFMSRSQFFGRGADILNRTIR